MVIVKTAGPKGVDQPKSDMGPSSSFIGRWPSGEDRPTLQVVGGEIVYSLCAIKRQERLQETGASMRMILASSLVVVALAVTMQEALAASTCSSQRAACARNSRNRVVHGPLDPSCKYAFEVCMKTGVWDTRHGGPYGQYHTNVEKR